MTATEGRVTPLAIIGCGGFGREVLQLVLDINAHSPTFELLGFVDDDPVDGHLVERLGARILGTTADLGQIAAEVIIAVGASAPRRRLDAQARAAGLRAATAVHPWATVGRDVELSEGVVVGAGTRLSTNITVGRHSHVNVNCTVGHDVELGPFVSVYPGVHISGDCVIEDGAMLGTGCVLLPGVRVGARAEVGAGAVVVRDVAPETIVVAPAGRPTLRSGQPATASGPGLQSAEPPTRA